MSGSTSEHDESTLIEEDRNDSSEADTLRIESDASDNASPPSRLVESSSLDDGEETPQDDNPSRGPGDSTDEASESEFLYGSVPHPGGATLAEVLNEGEWLALLVPEEEVVEFAREPESFEAYGERFQTLEMYLERLADSGRGSERQSALEVLQHDRWRELHRASRDRETYREIVVEGICRDDLEARRDELTDVIRERLDDGDGPEGGLLEHTDRPEVERRGLELDLDRETIEEVRDEVLERFGADLQKRPPLVERASGTAAPPIRHPNDIEKLIESGHRRLVASDLHQAIEGGAMRVWIEDYPDHWVYDWYQKLRDRLRDTADEGEHERERHRGVWQLLWRVGPIELTLDPSSEKGDGVWITSYDDLRREVRSRGADTLREVVQTGLLGEWFDHLDEDVPGTLRDAVERAERLLSTDGDAGGAWDHEYLEDIVAEMDLESDDVPSETSADSMRSQDQADLQNDDRADSHRGGRLWGVGAVIILGLTGGTGAIMGASLFGGDTDGRESDEGTGGKADTLVRSSPSRDASSSQNAQNGGHDIGHGESSDDEFSLSRQQLRRRLDVPEGYVLAPPGSFQMGSPSDEEGRFDNETRHRVEITHPFAIKRTEVTQGEWLEVAERNPSYFDNCGPDCPVERVNWYEAIRYANARSRREGLETCYETIGCEGRLGGGCPPDENEGRHCYANRTQFTCETISFEGVDCQGYRLPTEAEWEYAARAGTTSAVYSDTWDIVSDRHARGLGDIAWYSGNSGVDYPGGYDCSDWTDRLQSAETCGPHPVAQKQPNPWGLHDMLGNVIEWTWDRPADYPSGRTRIDPTGASTGRKRVYRGCGWGMNTADGVRRCRAASRMSGPPSGCAFNAGFRLVRTLPTQQTSD